MILRGEPVMARVHITVKGRVQGVGYRNWTAREAKRRHLRGWVRNSENGDVQIIAEGEERELKALITELHCGPIFAKVTGVETDWEPGDSERAPDFKIRR